MTVLIDRQAVVFRPRRRVFSTPPMAIDPLTSSLTLRLRRPTRYTSWAWNARTTLVTRLMVRMDGITYRCSGQVSGGIRQDRGGDLEEYQLTYGLPYGMPDERDDPTIPILRQDGAPWCDDRDGLRCLRTIRLGQRATSERLAWVELEQISGDNCDLDLLGLTVTQARGPVSVIHHSVAFDAAASTQALGGNGVLTLAHTPVGSTDLAAFAGAVNELAAPPSSRGSATYDGAAMTELWDAASATTGAWGSAGYAKTGILTGARDVVSTLVTVDPFLHFLGVITMSGVDQTTPTGTFVGADGATSVATVTVGSVGADDLVIDQLYEYNDTTPTVGADQTVRNTQSHAAPTEFRQSTQPGTAGGVMSWVDAFDEWMLHAVAFKPSAGGGGPAVADRMDDHLLMRPFNMSGRGRR